MQDAWRHRLSATEDRARTGNRAAGTAHPRRPGARRRCGHGGAQDFPEQCADAARDAVGPRCRRARACAAHADEGKSPIQAFSDVVLLTMARETQFRTEAMTSRLAQLAIIDVLIACLSLTDYERAVETIRHTFEILSLKRY